MKKRAREIGLTLKYLRNGVNLSQKEIAKLLHIAQQTYAGYESGHHEPSIDILIKLANAYKVTLDYITARVFDDWVIHPFNLMEINCPSMTDMLEHSKMQWTDAGRFSFRIMDKRVHNEYFEDEQKLKQPPSISEQG